MTLRKTTQISNPLKESIASIFITLVVIGCTTSTNIISNPSSPYLITSSDSILVAEMENVSAYISQQLLTAGFSRYQVCNSTYSYAVDNEKNLLQWNISLPEYNNKSTSDFQKIIKHTAFDYLLISKLLSTKSGETIYEGNSRDLMNYTAEEVTIGFKLYDLKNELLVKDFIVTSTRRPIKHRDKNGETNELPMLVSAPIGRAVTKGFKKISKESVCK